MRIIAWNKANVTNRVQEVTAFVIRNWSLCVRAIEAKATPSDPFSIRWSGTKRQSADSRMANNTDIDLASLIQLSDVDLPLDSPLIMDMMKNLTINSTMEREMNCTLQQNHSQVRAPHSLRITVYFACTHIHSACIRAERNMGLLSTRSMPTSTVAVLADFYCG